MAKKAAPPGGAQAGNASGFGQMPAPQGGGAPDQGAMLQRMAMMSGQPSQPQYGPPPQYTAAQQAQQAAMAANPAQAQYGPPPQGPRVDQSQQMALANQLLGGQAPPALQGAAQQIAQALPAQQKAAVQKAVAKAAPAKGQLQALKAAPAKGPLQVAQTGGGASNYSTAFGPQGLQGGKGAAPPKTDALAKMLGG